MTNLEWLKSLDQEDLAELLSALCESSASCSGCPLAEKCPGTSSTWSWYKWLGKRHEE